jgi:hypothetical protein
MCLRKRAMSIVRGILGARAAVILFGLVFGAAACDGENDAEWFDAAAGDAGSDPSSPDSGASTGIDADLAVRDQDSSAAEDGAAGRATDASDSGDAADAAAEFEDSDPSGAELSEAGPTDGASSQQETSWEPPPCPHDDPSEYAEVNIRVTVVAEETGEPISADTVEWYYQGEVERNPGFRAERFSAESVDSEGSVWHVTEPACGGIYVNARYVRGSDSQHCRWHGFDVTFIEADPTITQEITLRPATTRMSCGFPSE